MAYRFVDGRSMTNGAKPTEVDHTFINVRTSLHPSPLYCNLSLPLRGRHHSESDMQYEPITDKPATHSTSLWFVTSPLPLSMLYTSIARMIPMTSPRRLPKRPLPRSSRQPRQFWARSDEVALYHSWLLAGLRTDELS